MSKKLQIQRQGEHGGEFKAFNLVTTTTRVNLLSTELAQDPELYVRSSFSSELFDHVSTVVIEQVSQFGDSCLVRLYSQDIHTVVKILLILMVKSGETYNLRIIAERSVLVDEYPAVSLTRCAAVMGVPGISIKIESFSTDAIIDFMIHRANYLALPVHYGPLKELYHAPHVTKIEDSKLKQVYGTQEEKPQKVSRKLVMPYLIVSKVIGRGGCLINAIRKETQAQIIVCNVDVSKVFWQDILVQGSEEQVTKALAKIRLLAKS